MAKIRVGIVNFLNSKPLAWGFLKGHHADLFAPSFHPPSVVARLLAQGNLEIGLLPSVELLRIPGLKILPDLCVAATREVRSVLLVSRRPLTEIRQVALDKNSRTSAVLLRLLLRERYGLEPRYVEAQPEVDRMLAESDAALVIGDAALKVERDGLRVMDLAAEWKAMTGLPFVFAVWAVRGPIEVPDLSFYFKSSLRYGLSSLDILVREAVAQLGLSIEEVHTYLTENLSYFMQDEEVAGLREFLIRAQALGDEPEPAQLSFWGENES